MKFSLYKQYLLNRGMECHQTCMDISLGQAQELIKFGELDLNLKATRGLEYVKFSLHPQYLVNKRMKFRQTCIKI